MDAGPSGRLISNFLGSATFQTAEADAIGRFYENFHCFEDLLIWPLSVSSPISGGTQCHREFALSKLQASRFSPKPGARLLFTVIRHSTQERIRSLQQLASLYSMTAFLSRLLGFYPESDGSPFLKCESRVSNLLDSNPPSTVPPTCAAYHQRQPEPTDPCPCPILLSISDTSNTVGNLRTDAGTLAQQIAVLKAF
ncbi:hypothetical protein EI94DRAFT_350094 [Lactarius quietus]|nr:hypothetical protein EI94DRAFT_350094 [Lactarius quietus]